MLLKHTMNNNIWPSAEAAAGMVESGMTVGLGTGRAAGMFVRALARRVEKGLSIKAIPTSMVTEELAEDLGLRLVTFSETQQIDIDVDGADEVDPDLNLIKGHGGALLRERVVASVSKLFVVLVGEDKMVPFLGAKKAVPVEVVPFAVDVVAKRLREIGAGVELRITDGSPFESDNGNQILDARFETIDDVDELALQIGRLPGVVDNGLFVGMADVVLVQEGENFRKLIRS